MDEDFELDLSFLDNIAGTQPVTEATTTTTVILDPVDLSLLPDLPAWEQVPPALIGNGMIAGYNAVTGSMVAPPTLWERIAPPTAEEQAVPEPEPEPNAPPWDDAVLLYEEAHRDGTPLEQPVKVRRRRRTRDEILQSAQELASPLPLAGRPAASVIPTLSIRGPALVEEYVTVNREYLESLAQTLVEVTGVLNAILYPE